MIRLAANRGLHRFIMKDMFFLPVVSLMHQGLINVRSSLINKPSLDNILSDYIIPKMTTGSVVVSKPNKLC